MSAEQYYYSSIRFIRDYHKSLDPITQFCVETAASTIKEVLFPRHRWG